jgi:hypothetical protein
MTEASRRVRRSAVTNDGAAPDRAADFACAYEVDIAPGDERSAEQWAREAWEGAPGPLRWFMVAGWRWVLGLRLGPRPSPDHILGWTITRRSRDETVCQLGSPFLRASNIFRRVDGTLVWSTHVTYDRAMAKVIWPLASVLHRPLVRIALRRASRPPQ